MSPSPPAAFYCVSSDVYFLGAVGLINSLRLVGHDEPIHVLDRGLTAEQRELLEPEVTLVTDHSDSPPWLAKTVAPLAHPAETMVLIDADMIVTRPLTELIERAATGRVLAVEHGEDRHVPAWGELLDLGEVRRQTYVSSGLVIAGGPVGDELIRLMDDRQRRVEFERGCLARNELDYPLLYLDQDVLNAILATRVDQDRIEVVDRRLEVIPPFEGLRILDLMTLRCAYEDGTEPLLLHHYVGKPWLELTFGGVYADLLQRLLGGDDVAVRVPRRMIPAQLREGYLADGVRRRARGRSLFSAYVGDPIGERLESLRARS
jgi:hypothetical protein